ncbi:Tox-REase-5 domain-containing protein [Streptomyces sp. Tu 6176]|uniref:Tox-REase-5 domain-containing protein n=1 Tax=Streptomyces sp. Tu 6176 TaxID=1470557 RepID=UPI001F48D174|nr:Tox-REase-5 domain-containing protein [Streptomyces sp. Tu 6176]
MDAAARTGIDCEDAWIALRTLGLPEEVLASIGTKALDALRGACKAVSLTRITIAGKRCWVETGGPGVWQWVKDEAKDKPAAVAYEEQITGIPVGFGYVIHGTPNARGFVKFDGYKDGVLVDAKGENYAWAVKNGIFRPDFKGAQSMVDQANRQLAVVKAVGAKTAITRHVAEEETSVAIRNLFADNGISGIQVTHTPKQQGTHLSDDVLSVFPTDPQWQPSQEAAKRAVKTLELLAPGHDGVKATWHDKIMFIDCGSRFDQVSCPRCSSVLDRTWLGDQISKSRETGLLDVISPCCGVELSLNDLIYRDPCGLARFDISVWNPGRSWLTNGELKAVGKALGHPQKQVMAHY